MIRQDVTTRLADRIVCWPPPHSSSDTMQLLLCRMRQHPADLILRTLLWKAGLILQRRQKLPSSTMHGSLCNLSGSRTYLLICPPIGAKSAPGFCVYSFHVTPAHMHSHDSGLHRQTISAGPRHDRCSFMASVVCQHFQLQWQVTDQSGSEHRCCIGT